MIAGVVSAVLAVLMVQGVVPIRGFEFLGTSVVGAALRGLGAGVGVGALFGYILGMGMWDDDGEPESPIVMGETVVAVSGAADGGTEARTLRDAGGRLV